MTNNSMKQLLNKMTTAEKVGQLQQLTGDFYDADSAAITGPAAESHLTEPQIYNVGSVLGISGYDQLKKIQAHFLHKNRLHIPLLFMADIVHGYRTIFPIPLALGATFDPKLVEKAAAVAAKESAAGGLHVTFSPMVDLVRDPRWGRVMESTGEDPHLNEEMARAFVRGYQGTGNVIDKKHIAACVKHFAGYGAPEAGREYNTVDMSEWRFRSQYLSGYQAAIDAKAKLVMTSFNTLFGVPATANTYLMRDVLRTELKFNGVLISDWNAIGELIAHGVAADIKGAAQLALKAGVDINMMTIAYFNVVEKMAATDPKLMSLIDEATLRILTLKEDLGLFTDPFRGITAEDEQADTLTKTNLAVAEKAAEGSLVLLKNDHHILPLKPSAKVTLAGPLAATGDILGSWSWKGVPNKTETVANALNQTFKSLKILESTETDALAAPSDAIVAVLGLPTSQSGEATSKVNLQLPAEQLALLKKLKTIGKPLIAVVLAGRPLVLNELDQLADAVVFAWHPGIKGSAAIARLLSGAIDAEGRLPMSFPRSVGQIPIYYNQFRTGRPLTKENKGEKYLSQYIDCDNTPLYPFGYGLTYAQIELDKIRLSTHEWTATQKLTISAEIRNQSNRETVTVVQCYLHQLAAETVQPVQQLCRFEKIHLKAYENKTVQFELSEFDLRYVHQDLQRRTDTGDFEILVGLNSADTLKDQFHFMKER